MIGRYNGYEYKLQRICDVIQVRSNALWYFLYEDGEPTGDHFARLTELKRYIDALPNHKDAS